MINSPYTLHPTPYTLILLTPHTPNYGSPHCTICERAIQ